MTTDAPTVRPAEIGSTFLEFEGDAVGTVDDKEYDFPPHVVRVTTVNDTAHVEALEGERGGPRR